MKSGTRTISEYAFDGDDLRIKKTVKKSTNNYAPDITNYLYSDGNVILQTDDSNNLKVRYIMGINYIARIDGTVLSNYLYDGHGSVVQMVEENGTVQNSYTYDEWGNIVSQTGTIDNDITYAGYQYDKETGAYYLMSRMYDPITARFIQEDTYKGQANDPLSLNLYTYCENEPIMQYDPDGHFALEIPIITNVGKAIISSIISSGSNNHTNSSLSLSNSSGYNSNSSSKSSSYTSGSNLLVQNFLNLIDKKSISTNSKKQIYDTVSSYQNGSTDKIKNIATATQKINITPPSHVAYIFYLPEWEDQAKNDREKLSVYYNLPKDDVKMVKVSKDTDLINGWNGMFNENESKIDAVIINTHANSEQLGFKKHPKKVEEVIDSSEVAKLKSKSVSRLIIYGCNAGHLDNIQNNPAVQFANKINGGEVLVSDGTVYGGKRYLVAGSINYESRNDKDFKSQLNYIKGRNNQGWIIYQYLDNKLNISQSLGKNLTLAQMLSKLK